MAPRAKEHEGTRTPEARAERRASRAGSTYARFVREVATAGGYTKADAERYAIATIATLEERLPIADVCALEAQLPSRLDQILAFQPLLGLPKMDRELFFKRLADRLEMPSNQVEEIGRIVFGVLRKYISPGESRHVEGHLPDDLKALWTGVDRAIVPTKARGGGDPD
jgi:uncharacterized protein (DUF2267 family)